MTDNCPNCDKPSLGETCVRMELRGTGIPVDAALCSNCGTVYIPSREFDTLSDRQQEWYNEKHDDCQTKLDTF